MAGLPWIRLDADYYRNTKAHRAGVEGRALHIASICWSAEQMTDGVIEASTIPILQALAEIGDGVDALVDNGLWIPAGNGGFVLNGYADKNPLRADVAQYREAGRERQKKWRESHRG